MDGLVVLWVNTANVGSRQAGGTVDSLQSGLSGRSFLITGGTGSFGRTMVTRLLKAGASKVRVLSRDEAKQEAMRI